LACPPPRAKIEPREYRVDVAALESELVHLLDDLAAGLEREAAELPAQQVVPTVAAGS
jgi:hypothetical protein